MGPVTRSQTQYQRIAKGFKTREEYIDWNNERGKELDNERVREKREVILKLIMSVAVEIIVNKMFTLNSHIIDTVKGKLREFYVIENLDWAFELYKDLKAAGY